MPDKLPKGWKYSRLEDLVLFQKGRKPQRLSSAFTENSIPYLDIKAIEKNEIRNYADIESSVPAKENDLLIVWDGARSGWVGTLAAGAVGSTIMKIEPVLMDSKYLFYFLRSNFEMMNSATKGTGIPHLNPDIVWNLNIPVPPLREQKRISASLDTLYESFDIVQSRLDNFPKIIAKLRQQILHQAVTGKLTKDCRKKNGRKLKAHSIKKQALYNVWTITPLGRLAQVISGYAFQSKAFIGKGIPVVKISNIYYGEYVLKNQEYLPKSYLKKHKDFIVRPNDLLLALTRPITNDTVKVCFYPSHSPIGLLNQRVCKIDAKNKMLSKKYLYIYMQSEYFKKFVQDNLTQTLQPNLSPKALENVGINLPKITEQQEIVKRVQTLFKQIDRVEKQYRQLKKTSIELPQAILSKAYNGKLVPQNPKDEPVEKLLEQVREEKAEMLEDRKELRTTKARKKAGKKRMAEQKRKDLLEVIQAYPNGISPEDLLNIAQYDLKEIALFYKRLKEIREKIIEIKPSDSKRSWPKQSSVLLKARR